MVFRKWVIAASAALITGTLFTVWMVRRADRQMRAELLHPYGVGGTGGRDVIILFLFH